MAHFAVSDFKSAFRGGARPNLFKAFVTPPSSMDRRKQSAANTFEYVCQTTSLPGDTVGIIEQPFMGRVYKIPGNRTFEDWTTTVVNDEDMNLRAMFEEWSQLLGHSVTNVGSAINTVYASDLYVIQYNRLGNAVREYNFQHAWPSIIGPVELSWETNDAVETYDITWTYSWHETNDMAGAVTKAFSTIFGSRSLAPDTDKK